MSKKEIWELIMVGLIVMAVLSIVFVTFAIVAPPKRTTKAVEYDLNCITKMGGRPLQDCRIKSDKCMFEIEGTNTYEIRPWEDCEE